MGIVDEPLGERAEPLGMHLKPLGHRHPHLLRIAVIQVVGALVVAVLVEVLWIPDVRIVVETVPVLVVVRRAPLVAVGLRASPTRRLRGRIGCGETEQGEGGRRPGHTVPYHRIVPLRIQP